MHPENSIMPQLSSLAYEAPSPVLQALACCSNGVYIAAHHTHTHPHCAVTGASCLYCHPLDGDIIQPNFNNRHSLPLGLPC